MKQAAWAGCFLEHLPSPSLPHTQGPTTRVQEGGKPAKTDRQAGWHETASATGHQATQATLPSASKFCGKK